MDNNIDIEPIKKKRKVVLFIWILPIIAVIIASLAIYKHYSQMGEELTVTFKSADGFIANKTPLKYKGIKIGVISDIQLDEKNINKFLITIKVEKKVKNFIGREGMHFWKVEPKVTLSEVSGLNTILSGNYIEVSSSNKNKEEILNMQVKTHFIAEDSRPIDAFLDNGIFIQIKSNQSNINVGAPLLYKSFLVGEVIEKKLIGHDILYKVFVQNEYKNLVKEDSNFWNVSGINVKASLSGVNVKIDNLKSLVVGGITFNSNENSKSLTDLSKIFKLYSSKESIGYSEKIITLKAKEAYKLEKELSKIYYRGMVIGKVVNVEFLNEKNEANISIQLREEYLQFLNYSPHFQIIKPEVSINKISGLSSLIKNNFIQLTTGIKNKPVDKPFYILSEKERKVNMYKLTLDTSENTKITKNSPVFYKNIKIGYVSDKYLNKKTNKIKVLVNIDLNYRSLVNDSSLFYEQSPVEVKASLKEISFKLTSLKNFINTGIAVETYNLKQRSTNKSFSLHKDYAEMKNSQYLLAKGKFYQIKVDDISLLKSNDIIYYKGIEAGKVLDDSFQKNTIFYRIFILDKFTKLINQSTKFYSISGIDVDLSLNNLNIKTKSLDTLVNGGISFTTPVENDSKVKTNHIFNFYKTLNASKSEFVSASITMERGFNLKIGSKIIYKDLVIGNVKDLKFTAENKVLASVDINKLHEKLLNKNTIFYLDDFKFSLKKIENPSGALFGSNIKVIEGDSSIKQTTFDLLTTRPIERLNKDGLRIIVNTKLKSSLTENSPVFYRQLQIGMVEKYELSADSTNIKLQIFIEDKYTHLIRKNSIFYNAGAFGVDLSLFGVKIKTETLETLINGGISLVTPTKYGVQAKKFEEFSLYKDLDKDWLEWNPKLMRKE